MLSRALTVAACAAAAAAAPRGQLREVTTTSGGLCDPNVKQFSGYYSLATGLNKHYFYWGFESRNDPANDPVVLWMTGGPGCSSQLALFVENGPCKVNAAANGTTLNPYSWNSNATLLYVDQPTGTGFSYGTGFDKDEKMIASDMFDFLQQFFLNHPEYQQRPFYVVGESYGGHYVPALTYRIWKENQIPEQGKLHINLQGTSVGNGLTNPEIQYKYYPEMAASTNGHTRALNASETLLMRLAVPECVNLIKKCDAATNATSEACLYAMDFCNLALVEPYQLSGKNVYDMRVKCEKPPLCYDFSNVETFVNQASVKQALGVNPKMKWTPCDKLVTIFMEGDWMHHFEQDIPAQLAAGIRVQIYAGDQDYICNWLGNKAWVLDLEWPGKDAFNKAADEAWMLDGREAAKVRSHGGFSFVQVHEAGHMVPMDQPKFALEMLNRFIHPSKY